MLKSHSFLCGAVAWLLQFEITEREASWSGHIEIGLSAERRRVNDNNVSGMSCDTFYFKPASRTFLPLCLSPAFHVPVSSHVAVPQSVS